MGDAEFALAGHLVQAWQERLTEFPRPIRVGGEVYELADEDDYAKFDEVEDAEGVLSIKDDAPLIYRRERDGAYFEVEVDAFVRAIDPERERVRKAARQWQAEQARARREQQLRANHEAAQGLTETANPEP